MRDTTNQVARVTKELRALLIHLHWSAFQDFTPADQNGILNELLDASLFEDLRTTVDQLSHLLWCYVESAATASSADSDDETRSQRLRKITEMLRRLHRSSHPAQNPLAFVERLTQSVDRHLQTAGQSTAKFEACVRALAAQPEPDDPSKSLDHEDAEEAMVSMEFPRLVRADIT